MILSLDAWRSQSGLDVSESPALKLNLGIKAAGLRGCTVVALASSGSTTASVALLVKPISPLAMSGVTVRVRLRAPPNRGLMEGMGVRMSTSSTLSSWRSRGGRCVCKRVSEATGGGLREPRD